MAAAAVVAVRGLIHGDGILAALVGGVGAAGRKQAAFRQEGGGDVEAARLSEAQPRARVSFSALKTNDSPCGCRFGLKYTVITTKSAREICFCSVNSKQNTLLPIEYYHLPNY